MPKKRSRKAVFHKFLTQPWMVIVVLLIATLLSQADRNYGYFFGLGVVFLILWTSRWNWKAFGLATKLSTRTVLISLLIAVASFVLIDGFIQPLLEIQFGEIDLSSLDHVRGDVPSFLILTVIVWIFAAFGEELLFHGYYQKRLAELWGNSHASWLIAAVFIAAYFGISHAYQGPAGMVAVGLGGLINGVLFYKNRKNLALLVLVHGFYDMIGLTLIFLDKDKIIFDWYASLF